MTFSDFAVRQARTTGKAYTLPDSDGLSLAVAANGSKSWHFRYQWTGAQKRMSLGTYPEVSLRDARSLRDEARAGGQRLQSSCSPQADALHCPSRRWEHLRGGTFLDLLEADIRKGKNIGTLPPELVQAMLANIGSAKALDEDIEGEVAI
jgi:hypothetical protein